MTINDRDFQRLVAFVRDKFGINLERKRQLIEARLSFDISRRGYSDFSKYINTIIAQPDGDECRRMINRLSTNYTFFFREPDYVNQLADVVLPDLASAGRKNVSVWCAACSSGQEPYSAAMVMQLYLLAGFAVDYSITATDINTEMLAVAKAGVYPSAELDGIPMRYHRFIHHRQGGAFEIESQIKDRVTVKYANLLEMDCKEQFDVIFCRNVMIYFTPQLRRETTKMLNDALRPGGYLFTGVTESIDLERRYFRYIAPAFYQKAEKGDALTSRQDAK